jgi:hypothetical protein
VTHRPDVVWSCHGDRLELSARQFGGANDVPLRPVEAHGEGVEVLAACILPRVADRPGLAVRRGVDIDEFVGVTPALGLATLVQTLPSKWAVNVARASVPLMLKDPTAHTSSGVAADTPRNIPFRGWPAFGVCTVAQLLPSQCSASVLTLARGPVPVSCCPTAQTSLDKAPSTAFRPACWPVGPLVATDQVWPSQYSISGVCASEAPPTCRPTVIASVGENAATSCRTAMRVGSTVWPTTHVLSQLAEESTPDAPMVVAEPVPAGRIAAVAKTDKWMRIRVR